MIYSYENDTEFSENIPGMVDSIIVASQQDLQECSFTSEWYH